MQRLRPVLAPHALATALLLSLALLLAGSWGQIHRSLHLGLAGVSASADPVSADAWGHEDGSSLCQLLDQLAHGDAPLAEPALALLALAHHPQPAAPAPVGVWPARHRPFEARAPPSSA